MSKIH